MGTGKLNRRDFLKVSALGTAGLAAAATGVKVAGAKPTIRRLKQQATTIRVIDPWGAAPTLDEAQDAQIQRFMDSHPNIRVERSDIPFADFRQMLIQGALAGEVPDVVLIDNPDFHAFAALGVLADITDLIEDWDEAELYFPGHWSSTVFQDANYGIPVFSNCLAWWINTDMKEEAGIDTPESWDDLREAAAALTSSDRFGTAVSGIHSEEGTFQWLSFLWSTGSDLATINDEGGQAALQLWVDLVNEGHMSRGVLGWTQWDVKDEFGNQRAAMMLNGPWNIPSMTQDYPEVNWETTAIPKAEVATSILGGENYGISGTSNNREAAWEFISWTQQPENYRQFLIDCGMFPSREDMAEDPYWVDDPVLSVFLEQVKVARPRAYGANYLEMSNAIQDAIQAAVTGESTVEEALDAAAEIITPLLPEEDM